MTVGFIGTGNMGSALARAAAKTQHKIFLSDKAAEKAEALAKELNATAVTMAEAALCDYVFLGVKPQMLADLLKELAPVLALRKTPGTIVSMAAGVAMSDIQAMLGMDYPIIRIMPNTPVMVGAGMMLYCHNIHHKVFLIVGSHNGSHSTKITITCIQECLLS